MSATSMECRFFWMRHAAVAPTVAGTKSASADATVKDGTANAAAPVGKCIVYKTGTIRHLAAAQSSNVQVGFHILYREKHVPDPTVQDLSFYAKPLDPERPFGWYDPDEAINYPDKAPQDEKDHFEKWRAGGYAVLVQIQVTIS